MGIQNCCQTTEIMEIHKLFTLKGSDLIPREVILLVTWNRKPTRFILGGKTISTRPQLKESQSLPALVWSNASVELIKIDA